MEPTKIVVLFILYASLIIAARAIHFVEMIPKVKKRIKESGEEAGETTLKNLEKLINNNARMLRRSQFSAHLRRIEKGGQPAAFPFQLCECFRISSSHSYLRFPRTSILL